MHIDPAEVHVSTYFQTFEPTCGPLFRGCDCDQRVLPVCRRDTHPIASLFLHHRLQSNP